MDKTTPLKLTVKDSFVDLERERRRLEENVQQLRKSLQHWQLWEAEYEGLKEEISALNDDQSVISTKELEKVGEEFGGDLLNQKEIKDLFRDGKGSARNASQIQGLLSRRIDYVQENVNTMQRRLSIAEEKLQAVTAVSQPRVTDEEGLPLTEIREELDDDDNIISSSLSKPGDSTPQMLEALKKAGVDVPSQDQEIEIRHDGSRASIEPQGDIEPQEISNISANDVTQLDNDGFVQSQVNTMQRESILGTTPKAMDSNKPVNIMDNDTTKRPFMSSSSRKKSVSFSEIIQIEPPIPLNEDIDTSQHGRKTSQDLRDEMLLEEQMAFRKNATVKDIQPDSPIFSPVIPPDDSPEEAALRKQMLNYNMNEVGNIVAEIDLDDNGSYDSERFDESDDTDVGYEDDEEEDEYGRTTKKVIDDDYRAQMLALERKLNARMLENVGPHGERDMQQAVSRPSPHLKADVLKETVNEKKAVRFADDLDTSEAAEGAPDLPSTKANPLSNIVEHSLSASEGTQSIKPKKPSKFKASRLAKHDNPEPLQAVSSSPDADKSYSSPLFAPSEKHKGTVLERTPPIQLSDLIGGSDSVPIPAPPDEFDDVTMSQELAIEYNRLRNRMIQRQGGFMKATEEDENVELEPSDLFGEHGSDGGKKVSRFKAARLGVRK